jgi:hypothetical protein
MRNSTKSAGRITRSSESAPGNFTLTDEIVIGSSSAANGRAGNVTRDASSACESVNVLREPDTFDRT